MKKPAANKGHLFLLLLFAMCSCCESRCKIEPCLSYVPNTCQLEQMPSAFPPLAKDEAKKEWGKELYLGNRFALELDLYRAITAYKRALFLLNPSDSYRKNQIEYSIIQCYYFGEKYREVLSAYETGSLVAVDSTFSAFRDLMIILSDSYLKTDQKERSCYFQTRLMEIDPESACKFQLSQELQKGDIEALLNRKSPELDPFLIPYASQAKSAAKAKTLQAIIPGSGYLYVGQTRAALTSFAINALFIGAAYCFFDNGNVPAGLITASIEAGWYFGGINGAGLAAKEYNERVYEVHAKTYMTNNRLFPVLMLQKAF